MAESILPPYTPYVIRATWHYGRDYRVTEYSGPFIMDALLKGRAGYARMGSCRMLDRAPQS